MPKLPLPKEPHTIYALWSDKKRRYMRDGIGVDLQAFNWRFETEHVAEWPSNLKKRYRVVELRVEK